MLCRPHRPTRRLGFIWQTIRTAWSRQKYCQMYAAKTSHRFSSRCLYQICRTAYALSLTSNSFAFFDIRLWHAHQCQLHLRHILTSRRTDIPPLLFLHHNLEPCHLTKAVHFIRSGSKSQWQFWHPKYFIFGHCCYHAKHKMQFAIKEDCLP